MKVKNWQEFQHFKNRTPPWIKLYRYLLDDPEWHNLSDKAAKTLVMIWLVASEDKKQNGNLPCLKKLSFRLRMKEDVLDKQLQELSHFLILDDIKMISGRYQDDINMIHQRRGEERRKETETETDICSEPHGTSEPPILSIPLIKKDGEFEIVQDDIDQWQETYPGIDVKQTLLRIRQWSVDNPSRRKTKTGIRKHVSMWLGREQDKARGQPVATRKDCGECKYNQGKKCANLEKPGFDPAKCTAFIQA